MEEQLKRSRGLLSNAFHATNSKLNRLHTSPELERAKPSVIAKGAGHAEARNHDHLKTFEMPRTTSPDFEETFPKNSHPQPHYATQNHDYVSSGSPPESDEPTPSLMPSSRYMPTFSGFYSSITTNTNNYTSGYASSITTNANNYTSGYESSYSQSELNAKSPEPTTKSTIFDHQADSCFESDSTYQPNESPRLFRRWGAASVDDLDGEERLSLRSIKRKKSPDYCWEVINSQDLPSTKNQVPLKKRQFSHDPPADRHNLNRPSITIKRTLSNTSL